MKEKANILWFSELRKSDVVLVGGKSASLGEMYSLLTSKGINIPNGFSTTARAYLYFLAFNGFDAKLKEIFSKYNPNSLKSLQETGKKARDLILSGKFPEDLKKDIILAYRKLCEEYGRNTDVAVRSSATAEDLPNASFAGQHETYLNVKGEKGVMAAVLKSYSSLFTDRAISYRHEKGFEQLKVYLASCVQKMIRSDLASSGIMFTIDTETGFSNVVSISSIYGVGELIVKGRITPDEFYVFKPTLKQGYDSIIVKNIGRKTRKYIYGRNGGLREIAVKKKDQEKFSLTKDEVLTLAKWGCIIEEHYNMPQDIEWAKDGKTGKLFVVQSRPETVHASKKDHVYEEYKVKTNNKPLLTGIAVGEKIGFGKVRVITDLKNMTDFQKGEILVTKMTDPDWNSILAMSSAVVTDEGGKTCHSAIISRELGIPCIVGSKIATQKLKTGMIITTDCTQGLEGRIYAGKVPFEVKRYDLKEMPEMKTKIMLNLGTPESAFKSSFLPVEGVGLAREEFIIAEKVKMHPLALINFSKLKKMGLSKEEINEIERMTTGYKNKAEYYVDKLAEGISQIASAFYPKPVIVRFSDFKTNEYKTLIGGRLFEGKEENPMIGFRGACRYIDKHFAPAFNLECQAIKKARKEFGLTNISVMVPFCRTVEEGIKTREIIKKFGLNDKDLKVYVMCEIPSNVILIDKFLDVFDGVSIGSNDLTQLTLGLDRDNAQIAYIGNEKNKAVKQLIKVVIAVCKERGKYCGICGQAPSDYVDFAEFLVEEGIESVSLNPDTVIKTILSFSKKK